MNASEAIRKRRSIRAFKDEAVARETIEALLDAAVLAPSAKNSQPWHFTVITQDKRDEMLGIIRQGVANREAEGQEVETIRWSIKVLEQAPVTVFVHNPEGIHPWQAREEHGSWWDIATVQSVGAAIQNMLLAATERGLGSLWIADVWEAYPEINAWLETDDQLVSAVSFGVPDLDPPVPARKPIADVVRWFE